MYTRMHLPAAAAVLACAQALAAPPAAAPDAWSKVPALPTACLSSQDQQWTERNNAAIAAVQESRAAQNEKNTALDQQANQAMSENPMALAQAMQQAMLDDPENAQKMIEKMTQTGVQAQTEMPAQMEKEKQLEAESKALLKQYNAALDKAMGPAQARWNTFQKKMGWEVEPGFAMMPDPSWPQAAWQEWAAVQKDRDAAYTATCAQWWSATGQAQGYMKRYKAYLVQERIPYEKKLIDEGKLSNFKMLNVPADGYRTTTDMDAAIDYMNMASSVYGERMADPFCRKENACQ
jgi:hypothetical protein